MREMGSRSGRRTARLTGGERGRDDRPRMLQWTTEAGLARTGLALGLSLLASACGDDIPGEVDTEGTAGATMATISGPDPTTGSEGPTTAPATEGDDTTAGESSDTGFDPPVPACGNGFVEDGEQCDDANRVDDDACSNACFVPCGLELSTLVAAPTLDSQVEGIEVAATPDGGAVAVAFLREITTDQRGNQTIADDTVLVISWDDAGRLRWQTALASADGDVDAAGVVVDATGDVYVATTADAADGGRSIVTQRLAAGDGAEVWTTTFDGDVPGGDDIATGIALAPDGDLVVAGHVRVADGDNDVWVRKMGVEDGAEVWTATHSGTGSGGFSTDSGGPVAVAPDGEVYVVARLYADFETIEATLLRFDAAGAGVVWALPPDIAGTEQQWTALDVEATADGSIVYAFERVTGAELDFRVRKVDADAVVQWELDREAFVGRGADWRLSGLASVEREIVVAGSRTNDFTLGRTGFTDVWVVRLSGDGTPRCRVEHTEAGRGLVPPSVLARGVVSASDATAIVTGRYLSEVEQAVWLGWFRPN